MQINLLAVGRLKERYLQEAQAEYLKRISRYAKAAVLEVADESAPEGASAALEEKIKAREGQRLIKHIQSGAHVVALDREGGQMSSEEFSAYLAELGMQGKSRVVFIIGGSLGLSEAVLDLAHCRLSFSKMTFPHQVMRVVLLEQIYRAFKMIRGETYHK